MSGAKQVGIQIILAGGSPENMLGLLMPVSRRRSVYQPMVDDKVEIVVVFVRWPYGHSIEWVVLVVAPFEDVIMGIEMSGVVCRIVRKSTAFHWTVCPAP